MFGWRVASTAESASAIFLTAVMLGSSAAAFPAGWLAGPLQLGSRAVMAVSFILGAATFAALTLTTGFTAVLAIGVGCGVANGITIGATTVISAEVLPSVADSARDMNMLVTGPVVAQIAVTYCGGAVMQWLQSVLPAAEGSADPAPRLVWGGMWLGMATCSLLALPLLLCVRVPGRAPAA